MIIEYNIPAVSDCSAKAREYWAKTLFVKSISTSVSVNSLVSTYVRLVESAGLEYRMGEQQIRFFWSPSSNLNLSAFHKAVSHYEVCIVNTHRAIRCFRRLRKNTDTPSFIRDAIKDAKPRFASDSIARPIMDMRDSIQHTDDDILDSDKMPDGSKFWLHANGDEIPVLNEPGQTIKTIDRLEIGAGKVYFSDLVAILDEMGAYVALFADSIAI